MKKFYFTAIILFVAVAISAQVDNWYRSTENTLYWKNRKPFEGYWQQDVQYKIKASLSEQTDIVDGILNLTYYNNSPDTLSIVYFHLYQNAFIKGSYLEKLNIKNGFKQKFGKYENNQLGTAIERMQVNGQDAPSYWDNTIYKVELPQALLPNSSCLITVKFKTYFDDGGTQRRRMKLFKDAWGNKQYDGVHWYPRICVYDRKFGWETDQHLGKEFYGDFGSYDVELTLPSHYVLDATGVLQNRDEVLPAELRAKLDLKNFKDKKWDSAPDSTILPKNGTTKTWKFHADNVHDFAWVADPTFRIGEQELILPNGHKISCVALAQEPHASGWQDAAMFTSKVIEIYSRDIGAYAYPKMIVADARDGMEYPMLTLDGGSSPGYYGLLAHEVGHNWFFGMVGNNETYRASLDEGFTQFLTHWSMSRILPEQPKVHSKNKYIQKYYRPLPQREQSIYLGYIRDAMVNNDVPLNTHSDDFDGALNHGGGYGHVYYKTATMLYNLQYVLGDELFLASMQHYFEQWKFCHPYFEDFRSSIIHYSHVDLNWFFDQWLETTKNIDYSITKIEKDKGVTSYIGFDNGYRIKLQRVGTMQMPIDLHVTDVLGNKYTFLIPNTYYHKPIKNSTTFLLPIWKGWGILNSSYQSSFSLKAPIKSVIIDSSYRLADVNLMDNSTSKRTLFTFDHQIRNPLDRKHYILKWRPDVWYNSIDGLKVGLHINGNYMKHFDGFSATIWYNSGLAKDYIGGAAGNEINFNLNYRTLIADDLSFYEQIKFVDGLYAFKLGVEEISGQTSINFYYKSIHREGEHSSDYLLYPSQWNVNKENSSINLDLKRNYSYSKGSGEIVEAFRTTLLSDYNYSSVTMHWINHHNLGKLELHSRVFFQVMNGTDIALESMLNLAGGNNEEMMDNKFVRSRAFVPTDWQGYGNSTNHFQFGGGLNIRGYAGYLVPVQYENSQFHIFNGTSGAAINAELDFEKLIPFSPKRLSQYFHIDCYLFGDAGFIENKFNAGSNGLKETKYVSTDLIASAGTGVAFTIKKWSFLDEVKPLTFRFDMPLYLSNAPFVDGENFKFRWQVSINRAF